jgi:hypothetical protein
MITVIEEDGKLYASVPLDKYKKPHWISYMHIGEVIEKENLLLIPCRKTRVIISKPVVQRTPMGMVQSVQNIEEYWTYLDMPMKSILVQVGDDITNEIVDLELIEGEKE